MVSTNKWHRTWQKLSPRPTLVGALIFEQQHKKRSNCDILYGNHDIIANGSKCLLSTCSPISIMTMRGGVWPWSRGLALNIFKGTLEFTFRAWWSHQMETFSTLLAHFAGNSLVTGEFPSQRPVTRSFDVSFDLRLNKRLSKQAWCWWFETPSCSLWRHFNGMSRFHESLQKYTNIPWMQNELV